MRKPLRRQHTIVEKLMRSIQTKVGTLAQSIKDMLQANLTEAQQLVSQTKQRKAKGPKLYSWRAPETECLAKGKARTPYEFGVKVGITNTIKGNLILGARSFPHNPYEGHPLNEQLEQAHILSDSTIRNVYVDLGYRGVDADNPGIEILHRGKANSLTQQHRRWLKRRQAIEPVIGHLKSDHRMSRCWLKGAMGDAINAVLSAAGYNLRWLLRMPHGQTGSESGEAEPRPPHESMSSQGANGGCDPCCAVCSGL
jgi:IS5 family transposase